MRKKTTVRSHTAQRANCMIARTLAMMCEPTASVDVHTTSMAMGMDATRMTMVTERERIILDWLDGTT